jgi:hypothetical protein
MAYRVHLRPLDTGNYFGSLPVAHNDWCSGHADSMSARDNAIPLKMPDIRLQARPEQLNTDLSSTCGRSPYTGG